jgi:DNA-binding transcriptional regulator YhcF (GntR family)
MDLHADAQSPTPIRRPMAKAPTNVIKRGGLPREQALPSIRGLADSSGGDPNAVTRAIEDLKRRGYRPLRPVRWHCSPCPAQERLRAQRATG